MAKYKVMIGSQKYTISLSDVTDYEPIDEYPAEDAIKYTVEFDDDWNGTIYAHIERPSQHTLYLISQDRCYITINCRNFRGHGPVGNHMYDWSAGQEHTSGRGRGAYYFHKHWSTCLDSSSLLNNDIPIKVTDVDNIEIPFHYQISKHHEQWGDYYWSTNVHGYSSLEHYSDYYGEPERDSFYFDFRLALLSCQSPSVRYP